MARLRSWNSAAVEGAKFDREEMTHLHRAVLHPRGLRHSAGRSDLSL